MTFNSSQICCYYPKYLYLDNVLSTTGKRKLNLFIDLKGCMQSLFQEWAIRYIVANSQDASMVDSSIFASILEFLAFHKQYAKKRDIELTTYLFYEHGKSSYHLNIFDKYKANRRVGDFFGLDEAQKDLFFKVLNRNLFVIKQVCSKLPNVNVISLDYLEADFIPWYLME